MEEGKLVGMLTIDICKAFDSVNHSILLKRLNEIGIRGVEFKLFADFLKNRKQFVEIAGVKSQIKTVNAGIPQGIAAIMFIIFINIQVKTKRLPSILR